MMFGGRLIEPVSPRTRSCMPCQPSSPARVTTNEGMPKAVTKKPLKRPIAVPTSNPTTSARSGFSPSLTLSTAITDCREPADRADREVDLAEQQDEDHADRDRRHGGDLQGQVGEVDRGEEAIVGELEDRPDDRDPEQDPDRPELATAETAEHRRGREALAPRGVVATVGARSQRRLLGVAILGSELGAGDRGDDLLLTRLGDLEARRPSARAAAPRRGRRPGRRRRDCG